MASHPKLIKYRFSVLKSLPYPSLESRPLLYSKWAVIWSCISTLPTRSYFSLFYPSPVAHRLERLTPELTFRCKNQRGAAAVLQRACTCVHQVDLSHRPFNCESGSHMSSDLIKMEVSRKNLKEEKDMGGTIRAQVTGAPAPSLI